MLSFNHVSLRRGTQVLIDDAHFTLHRQQRVGLTGANGTGKSSLMALLLGELQTDSGELELQGGITIAHVAQETPALDLSALQYTLNGDKELRQLQQRIIEAEKQNEHELHSELLAQLEVIDGYTAESRAAKLLSGLGFTQAQTGLPVSQFSGGWRMRLNLAQALMCRSDLLLLDEPTNHLDMDAIVWLEAWLKQYAGTLILISHDRDFLDSLCTHIAHIEQQNLTLYTGNYSQFETIRAEKLALQSAAYEKQQAEIAHIQSFITRFKAKATKAKQAQSRIKTLERMEKLAAAHVDSPFQFQFLSPEKPLEHLLKLEDAEIGYSNPLLNKIQLSLLSGDRIGLLGPNGAGKSTLIKALAAELPLIDGTYQQHPDCKIAYFAQHQLEQLHPQSSALEHLRRLDTKDNKTEQELRDFLGGFGFQGDRVLEAIAPFSGGEKARLVLACLVFQRPHLLLLDEPTNHLDLEMRHALSMALQDFEGAVVIISHDRHMLRSVCDQLFTVFQGQLQPFDGSVDDYPLWLESQNITNASPTKTNNKKQLRQQEAERRHQLKPLQDTLKRCEKQIELISEQLHQLETQLSDETLYTSNERKQELQSLLKQQGELKTNLEVEELNWLEAQEALEQAQDG